MIWRVSRAIASLRPQFIQMPGNENEIAEVRQRFYNIARFPRCVGAIDCTHVKIQSPGGNDAEIYRNRKQFFSFNVQTICDPLLKIRDIVARWPGSSHDSTIFHNSAIYAQLENGQYGDHFIVGDSGYGSSHYMITPLANPQTPTENLFQESQIRTRNPVERSYGVWKRRFPCLSMGLRIKLNRIQAVIIATAILHNLACDEGDREPPLIEGQEAAINYVNDVPNIAASQPARARDQMRRRLITEYFQQLVENAE